MFDDSMKTEAIPERIFSLCQHLLHGPVKEEDIKIKIEPSCFNSQTSYFGTVRDAAIQLSIINEVADDKTLELSVDKKIVATYENMRCYINGNINKLINSQFYQTTKIIMQQSQMLFNLDKDLQSVSKVVPIINKFNPSLNLDEKCMRAWRFWGVYLGFGYLYDMFFMPNASVFLHDCIKNSKIKKGQEYSISDFMSMLLPNINVCIDEETEKQKKMNLALSNAFRSLHDLGIVKLKYTNDRQDEWSMVEMPLHEYKSLVTDIVYIGD